MKRLAPFVIVVGVALLTIGGGVKLYYAKRVPDVAASPNSKAADVHSRGPADAPVTMEEFGDFQCPPCGGLSGPLLAIEKDYATKLRVIFYNFPFAIHQHAREAAHAAEAAGLQGHFWEMHDLLYREQAKWSAVPDVSQLFESYAEMIKLDLPRFRKDVRSPQVEVRVARDEQLGKSLGVQNTPTLILNHRPLPSSSLNAESIRKAIDDTLAMQPAH